MKHTRILHKPVVAVAALVLIFALSATALAYSQQIYRLMTGGTFQDIVDDRGEVIGTEGSVDLENVVPPVELGEDGRLYLTIDGQNTDITDECSYETPYLYECTGADGLRHVFIIGGTLDGIGWAEFMWDEDGLPSGGSAHFGTPEGPNDAPWLDAGKAQLGLPW